VTDLQLAATSGLDLARRLLASQGDLAVVFISGGSTPPVATDVSPVTLLSKPFDAHALVAAIQRALTARRSRG
jgi:FixJ family two-component response regulator